MTTTISPQIGSSIVTHRGNGGIVERLENERVIIRAKGTIKSIPLKAIARWELPAPIPVVPEPITVAPPQPLEVGDVCELTEVDYLDAVGLVEVADNREAIEAVRSALTQVFTAPAEKRRLWEMLNPQQREKFSI